MERLKYFVLMLAIVSLSNAVKINLQGSVSLGKEVLESISHHLRSNGAMALINRRSGSIDFDKGSEHIKWTIQAANVWKGLKINIGPLGEFINDYIVMLATAIENIFDGILTHNENDTIKDSIFADYLKPILNDIHEILKEANSKIVGDKTLIEWITVIKKICARYQRAAINFVEERLDGDPQDISNVKKKLIQRIVLALILVENKYENRLCLEQEICEKEHIVTTSLNNLLSEFKNNDNKKAMEFVKYFYENLEADKLFYFLNMDTAHELQVILSDLSYTIDSPTKDVLLTVQKAVNARLNLLVKDDEISKAYDQQLVNVILSDLDYFYHSRHKNYPFDFFLGQFVGWHKTGGKFTHPMRSIIKELAEQLHKQSPALLDKLGYEVRVFLELTVDPDK